MGRNYLNSNEAKRLIEDVVRGYLKKEGKALLEPSVSKKISENKDAPSLQPTTIKEQSQFVNTQTVNPGYAERDSKDASMHSAPAQQQAVFFLRLFCPHRGCGHLYQCWSPLSVSDWLPIP